MAIRNAIYDNPDAPVEPTESLRGRVIDRIVYDCLLLALVEDMKTEVVGGIKRTNPPPESSMPEERRREVDIFLYAINAKWRCGIKDGLDGRTLWEGEGVSRKAALLNMICGLP